MVPGVSPVSETNNFYVMHVSVVAQLTDIGVGNAPLYCAWAPRADAAAQYYPHRFLLFRGSPTQVDTNMDSRLAHPGVEVVPRARE